MPPTFLLYLGLMGYIGATVVTFVVFIPMMFFDTKRLMAKKVLATVLISFPYLITMGLFSVFIFVLPALAYS